jgi:hypothetical protein
VKTFSYELPDTLLSNSFVAAAEQLRKSVINTTTWAVTDWAEKLGITPERWLEIYEPEVKLEPWQPGEASLTLKLVVTAKMRAGSK